MQFYDPSKSTLLTVDASLTELDAIFSNEDNQGNVTNVAYASKSMTEMEREALVVVWACERFYLYLIGTKFSLSADHN